MTRLHHWLPPRCYPVPPAPITIGYWDSALGGGVTPLASSAGTEILLQKQLLAPGLVSAISSRC